MLKTNMFWPERYKNKLIIWPCRCEQDWRQITYFLCKKIYFCFLEKKNLSRKGGGRCWSIVAPYRLNDRSCRMLRENLLYSIVTTMTNVWCKYNKHHLIMFCACASYIYINFITHNFIICTNVFTIVFF
jgi:hypothetical protein